MPDNFGSRPLWRETAAQLMAQQTAELENLRSQKRSLLATVTDLQALVRLLSVGRLAIVESEESER